MSDLNVTADFREVESLRDILGELAPLYGRVVARIERENKQLDRATNASVQTIKAASQEIINAAEQRLQKEQKLALVALENAAKISRANQETVNSLLGVSNTYKSAEQSASVFTEGLRKQEAQASVAAKQNQNIINGLLGVGSQYKSAAQSASVFTEVLRNQEAAAKAFAASVNIATGVSGPSAANSGASFSALDAEVERLTQKFNKIYAASQLYEKSLVEIDTAHRMGVISTRQHAEEVDRLNAEYQAFQAGTADAMNRFQSGANQSAYRLNNFGVATQQLGYQVGDFLVQVQSGTNWMVAFGQQATQLVGVLPLLSANLGVSAMRLNAIAAGLGIAIPLVTAIGAYFLRTSESTKKNSKAIDQMSTSLSNLDQALQKWINTKRAAELGLTVDQLFGVEDLESRIDGYYQQIKDLIDNRSSSFSLDPQAPYFNSAEQAEYERLQNLILQERQTLMDKIKATSDSEIQSAQQKLNIQQEYNNNLAQGMNQSEAMAKAQYDVQMALYQSALESQNLSQTQRAVVQENIRLLDTTYALEGALRDSESVSRLLEQGLTRAAVELLRASGVDLNNIDEALRVTDSWKRLLDKIKTQFDDLDGYQIDVSLKIKGLWENVPDFVKRMLGAGTSLAPETSIRPQRPGVDSLGDWEDAQSGTGGGGGVDKFEQEFEQLQNFLTSQTELEMQAYENRLDVLKTALDRKLITISEYQELEKELTKKHQEEMSRLDVYRYGDGLAKAEQFFGDMASALSSGNEKMAKAAKAFAAVEALINAYRAYNQVIADPTLPWFAKIPAAVSVLSAGLGVVQAIKGGGSRGVPGSTGGVGRGTTSVASTGPSVSPQTVYLSGVDPNALYTGEALIRLFDALYDENDKRGKVFVVQK